MMSPGGLMRVIDLPGKAGERERGGGGEGEAKDDEPAGLLVEADEIVAASGNVKLKVRTGNLAIPSEIVLGRSAPVLSDCDRDVTSSGSSRVDKNSEANGFTRTDSSWLLRSQSMSGSHSACRTPHSASAIDSRCLPRRLLRFIERF